MTEQMTVKIRSRDGTPIRVDALAKQIELAGCEIVSIPMPGTRVRTDTPATGWPPIKRHYSTVLDFDNEVAQ